MSEVTMTHPASTRRISVSQDQVPVYESQGWRPVAASKRARTRPTTKTAAESAESDKE